MGLQKRAACTWSVWYKTKFGSQNFGYQIWFRTRLLIYVQSISKKIQTNIKQKKCTLQQQYDTTYVHHSTESFHCWNITSMIDVKSVLDQHYSWWHHDMEMLSTLLALYMGGGSNDHWCGFPTQRASNAELLSYLLLDSLDMLLNKQPSYQRFEMPVTMYSQWSFYHHDTILTLWEFPFEKQEYPWGKKYYSLWFFVSIKCHACTLIK